MNISLIVHHHALTFSEFLTDPYSLTNINFTKDHKDPPGSCFNLLLHAGCYAPQMETPRLGPEKEVTRRLIEEAANPTKKFTNKK